MMMVFHVILIVATILKRWGNRSLKWLNTQSISDRSRTQFMLFCLLHTESSFQHLLKFMHKGWRRNYESTIELTLSCFAEFMPTTFRYALASSSEDKTKHGKHVLSWLVSSLLRILSTKLLKKSYELSASIASFSTGLVGSPPPLPHSAFCKVTGDHQVSIQSTFTLCVLWVTCRAVDSSLARRFSFCFRNLTYSGFSYFLLIY